MHVPAASPHRPWFRREAPHNGEPQVLDLGRLLLGLVIVAFGVLFLLDAAGVLNADKAVNHWWPTVIVAAGLLTLAERPPSVVRGTILTAIGVILLLFTTHLLEKDAWNYVWPVLVILVGLLIVLRWHGRTIVGGAEADSDDLIRSAAFFGSPKLASTSRQFRGASLAAFFGGITLDLRDATPAPDGAAINATSFCGGIDLLVPKGWQISIRSTPIFGGLDDKTDHSQVPAGAPTLHVDALTVLGGVDIKHEK
jgi:predicted membrane protein